ncbi:MAG: outer-membrane lipoprotein carrier protein LolA, partial [Hyphomicrobiales bacterium]|nr:outer-membrane lipoprotein carrier protein LolA [Hyphomicrobiales bacterium]
TAAEVIRKADAWLNKTRYLYAEFTQIGADGKRTDGQLYLDRPGRMSFSYNPPSPMEVVADGTSVAVRNRKLGTQVLYLVRQTPLKFLLADKVDLAKDVKVLSVSTDPQNPSVLIEDHRTLGGTSRVRLAFDPADFALKQWTVIDPQGYKTVVSLDKTVVGVKPDAKLFVIRAQPRQ